MTKNQIPNPLPSHAMIIGDDGMPKAVMDIGQMQGNAIKLAYDMAAACGDAAALDDVSAFWLDDVGPAAFGYAAAGALRMLAEHILDPTLETLNEVAPGLGNTLRAKLSESAINAEEAL